MRFPASQKSAAPYLSLIPPPSDCSLQMKDSEGESMAPKAESGVIKGGEGGIWECLKTTKVTSGWVKDGAQNRCPLIPVTRVTSTSINQTVWLPTCLMVCVQAGRSCRTAVHVLAAPPAPSEWIRPAPHFHCRGRNGSHVEQPGNKMRSDDHRWGRASLEAQIVKNLLAMQETHPGSAPGWGRPPREGNGNPL